MNLATMTKERIRAELALDAVRFIQPLYVTQGDPFAARDLFLRRFPISPSNDAIQKAITKTAAPGAIPTRCGGSGSASRRAELQLLKSA